MSDIETGAARDGFEADLPGTPSELVAEAVCPSCGEEGSPRARFCQSCGSPMDASTTRPAFALPSNGGSDATARAAPPQGMLPPEPAPPPADRPRGPMVGRERERELLVEAFDRTVGGAGQQVVVVAGPPGVGKTRLAEEFLHAVDRDDAAATVLVRCSDGPAGEISSLVGLVERTAGIDARDSASEARSKLDRALAGSEDGPTIAERLAQILGLAGGIGVPEETPWAVSGFLHALAGRRPLVVCLDDLHAAGPDMLRLVDDLAGRRAHAPLLVVCTVQPDLLDPRLSGRDGEPVARIELEPLSDEECGSIIRNLLGDVDLEDRAHSVVVRNAAGNALVVEQIVAMFVEEEMIRRDAGRWISATDLSALPPLPSLQALLLARLQELDADEFAALERAAIVGESFERDAVAELLPEQARPGVDRCLTDLVRKCLIRPVGAHPGGEPAFRFRHASIREVSYQGIAREIRAEAHERCGLRLERLLGDRAASHAGAIGRHLEAAYRCRAEIGLADDHSRDLGDRAAVLLASAGSAAEERGDVHVAADLLERAASVLSREDPRRPELLLRWSIALADSVEASRADAALTQAASAARLTGDRAVETRAALLRSALQVRADPNPERLETARRTVERAAEVFEELEDHWGLAWVWSLRAFVHLRRGYVSGFADAQEQAAEHARRAGRRREESAALRELAGAMLLAPGPIADVVHRCEKILERSRAVRLPQMEAWGALALLKAAQGNFDEARELAARSKTAADDLGSEPAIAVAAERAGLVEGLAGQREDAERELRRGYETATRAGDARVRARTAAELTHLIVGERAAELPEGLVEEALELSTIAAVSAPMDDIAAQVLWRTARASVLARNGSLQEADRAARDAVRVAEQTDSTELRAKALMTLAETRRLAGRTNEAVPFVRRSLRAFERRGAEVAASRARRLLEELAPRQSSAPRAGDVSSRYA